MKLRAVLVIGAMMLVVATVVTPILTATASNSAGLPQNGIAQTGPTATPNDPAWLGFSVARDALSEKLNTRITLVQRWQFAQTEFPYGIIEGCRALEEGEEEPKEYFGWRYVITLLNGRQYEVRVSFNLQAVIICDKVTSDIGGPAPAGPQNVGTVAAGPLEVGVQTPNRFGSTEIQYMQQGGFRWVKFQARPGVDFSGLISSAKAAGYKVLMSVVGDKSQIMNASYQDSYVDYLVALANDGADAIEVWNEPNLAREWPAGQINGANYVPLLKKAYEAIKAAKPNVIVISASPAPTGAFGAAGCTSEGCNDDVFYQQMAQAGAGAYADCIGVHYNEGIISPLLNSGDPRDNYPTRYFGANLNRAMANFPGEVACFTEIGYLSPEGYGPLPGAFAWAKDTSVAEQAQWLGEAVVLSSQLGYVRLFIIFNLNFTSYGADPQGGYAIVRPDGSCPACNTIKSALG
ncbi:MAG: hypothetical protein CUN55_02745 [Phototrophicales bacterium]|nr:MAG: hypothetical protein CUN55_02745 [Phototrophicales bacterium]